MKLVLLVAFATIFAISSADLISESLAAHRKWRSAVGVPDLVWNTTLARNAQAWADTIARNRRSSHSKNRVNTGENIAYGTTSRNSIDDLVGRWGAEAKYFVPGKTYPKCTTGSESDVWHYTQLVWQKSTQLGCGVGYSDGTSWIVCQYYPRGNMYGQTVYTTTGPSTPQEPVVTEPSTPVVTEPEEPETPVITQPSSDPLIAQSLAAHQKWRSAVGVPNLAWNNTLAANAQKWADTIARNGRSSHSKNRVNTGENIAYGTTDDNTIDGFVGLWGAESKYFVAGKTYPKCTTRSESDVWHYTQLVWQKTTQVGCGMGYSNGRSWYVCQYYPRGNMYGQTVFTTTGSNTPQQPVVTQPEDTDSEEPSTPTQPQQPEPSTPSSSDPLIAESLTAHSKWRSAVGVPNLVWNTTLARNAQKWADTIARNGRSSHSKDRVNTGENIAYGTTKTNTITGLIGLWGAESKYFVRGRAYPKCTTRSESDVWHYTQLVWRKTTQLGCGMGYSNGRSWYVCQYYPRGNMIGQTVF